MAREAAQKSIEDIFAVTLRDFSRPFRSADVLGKAMRHLMATGLTNLPAPGSGGTLERWRALAAVAALDLSLAKVYEGHTDALAILAELKGRECAGLWAVWAAEPPNQRVLFRLDENSGGTLWGQKAWCSGAAVIDHAVVSAWTESKQPVLAQVDLHQPDVTVGTGGWEAVGMAASGSVSVIFEGARAEAIGAEGDYVARPGFWQGGAGIAAVWYGGALAIARALAHSPRISKDSHAAAHLGAIDSTLRAARALLTETAAWIDAHPTANASDAALRVRACVETAANEVLIRTGRALGAAPLCSDAIHAQRCADLQVFLRQSHAEHDLVALGRGVAGDSSPWEL